MKRKKNEKEKEVKKRAWKKSRKSNEYRDLL